MTEGCTHSAVDAWVETYQEDKVQKARNRGNGTRSTVDLVWICLVGMHKTLLVKIKVRLGAED